jgi:Na+-driven multidrug efflux pump
MAVMLLCVLAFQTIPHLLLGIFNPSDDFLAIGISALRIVSLIFPLAAIGIALGASFQALGNGIYSTIISICRQLVVLLPVAFLMSLTGDVNKVWLAYPIAEIFSGLLTGYFFLRIYRQKIKPLFS